MDSSEGFSDDEFHSEIHRRKGSVFPTGALAVVMPSHDGGEGSLGQLFRPVGEGRIDPLEDVIRDGRNIRPEGQYLRTGGHDVICGDVVSDL